jgi:serine/threonine protein kinase/tetratricopeptide (TPR) repeat protein
MTQLRPTVKSIFDAALEISDAAERRAYLQVECGDDRELRAKVDALLAAYANAESFLESPPPAFVATITERTLTEAPGTVIGPYKLLEQIGEGGFGVVFMAEQTAPVKRKVALKVIKPGMDTRQVIARFEAERQALALMDHPHIAKVLDAGATETGRPFFVMELVRGVPITAYCDQNQLSPRERLELFVTVCQAVQHAHQKGIIHRDIKPTNVLVTLHDDKPVVKVIDFGVAKATSGQLTDKTLFTGFAQLVGTPLYMSPEQAALSGLDIDTRSDIYSLGVLLYELLTGTTPFDKTRLQQAAFDEVRRIIREEEPEKPSTRLSSLGATLPSVSAVRRTEPRKLSQLVRGDLDWIVMKALDKDRARRYETANGFAADVLRYLTDEPVTACPPSAGYRFRKFARRNKASLATAAMVAMALVAGIIGTTWQAVRATHEANRASNAEALADRRYKAEKSAREQANAARAEKELQRQRAEANFAKARAAVDEYLTQVTESELLTVPGLQPLREDLLEAALRFYTEFTQERAGDPTLQRELASAHYRLGRIHSELGNTDTSRTANAEAIRLYEKLRDAGHFDRDTQVALARAYFFAGRHDDTVRLCEDVLQAEAGNAEARSLLADTYNELAVARSRKDDLDAALQHHRQAFALRESLVRDFSDNPRYLAQLGGTINNLGELLENQKKTQEALALYERAVEYTAQAYERAPHSLLWGRWLCIQIGNVARVWSKLGRKQEALATYQRLVAVSRKRAFENPAVTSLRGALSHAHLSLARYQQELGNTGEAAHSFREAREVLENIPHETPSQLYELATVYAALAQPPEGAVEPDQDDAAEREHNIELTLQTLQKAVEAGYGNVQVVKAEHLFDVLRDRGEFQQVIAVLDKAAEARQLVSQNAGSDDRNLANRLRAAELLNDVVASQPRSVRHRSTLAATLHSIGVIQTGLKQFDEAEKSLREALQSREDLMREQPESAQALLDALSTRSALGQLELQRGRPREAHRLWQDILEDCRRAAADHAADTTLQSGVARIEGTISEAYGEIGVWELAAYAADQCLKRGQLVDAMGGCRGAHLLAAQGRLEEHRRFCRLLADKWGQDDPAQVVWAATMNPEATLAADELRELAGRAIKSSSDPMIHFQAATAWYRTGEYERALELMLPFRESLGDGRSAWLHWYAMVYHKLGQEEEAARYFEQAEALYLAHAGRRLQAPLASAVNDGHDGDLSAWAEDQAIRQAAWHEIHGPDSLRDSWQHLIQAGGYRLIGEMEKTDRELAAAVSATPDDPTIWRARARLLTQWNDPVRSPEADWQRAVELAGDDPLPWIDRGRWYAERGEQEKADADFKKAAALTPNELNMFLEAGWWVTGPYPPELKEFCPAEIDPNPSRPVHVVDLQAGLSDEPVPWRAAPTGRWGLVDLRSLPVRQEGASVYALAHVYSPEEQTKLLMVLKSQPLRVWVNGVLVEDYVPGDYPIQPHYEQFHRVPAVLRAGRNSILVKSRTADFTLRIGDTPRDRAVLLAEQERFTEAFAAHAAMTAADRDEPFGATPYTLRELVALLGTDEQCTENCRALLAGAQRVDSASKFTAAYICAHRPNPVFDQHAATLVTYVDDLLLERQDDWSRAFGALVHYRAGNDERARTLLDQSNAPQYRLHLDPLLAHRAGDEAAARRLLDDAFKAGAAYEASLTEADRSAFAGKSHFPWWYDWITFLTVLREAEQAICGATTQSDALRMRCEAIATAEWTQSPETAVFDHAVLFGSIDGSAQTTFPQPYLARGRRLAELGRLEAAEADFNKAVELSPGDADVLAARAVFLADAAQPDKAAADFHTALDLFDQSAEKPRWSWGVPIDLAVADRAEVFERLVALRPQDPRLLMTRMAVRMQRGDFEGSCSDANRLANYELILPSWRSAEALWRGDHEAAQSIRASAQRAPVPHFNIMNFGVAPTEEPMAGELLREVERMLQEGPQHLWTRRWLGLAQLRTGRYDDAVASLQASLAPAERWQKDGLVWPLLAIAHHHLGNSGEARRWLNRTAFWFDLRTQGECWGAGSATGAVDITPEELIYAMAFYQEAKTLIDGPGAAAAARELLAAHVHERSEAARARDDAGRQRALARAEADWQRIVDVAGNDPAPWIRRADWYASRGELAKAEADWQRAVELAGADPGIWIQRGRWYAERGETAKADADLAHAASLTPHELNKFLATGWWVVGPYPSDLKEFCPPETDPDPSRPVHLIDSQSGMSDEPTPWVHVSTGAYGAVDLTPIPGRQAGRAVYALAQVWSPDERSVLLMLGKTEPLRVWVNGKLVEDFTPGEYPVFPDYEPYYRVPALLTPRRNTVLIKTASPTFTLRIGDTPRDRAILLAEQRRFGEAVDALNALPFSPDDLRSGYIVCHLAPVLAADDRGRERYQQYCATAIAWSVEVEKQPWLKLMIPYVCTQHPNECFNEHGGQLVSFAEQYAAGSAATWSLPRLQAALASYRLGQYERAQSLLTEFDRRHPLSFPLQALLHQQLGDTASAVGTLEAAFRAGTDAVGTMRTVDRSSFAEMNWACWWHEWALFLNLLTEAEQAIRGETRAAEQLRADAEATQVRRWTESPELIAFDHAVLFTACGPDGLLKYPKPLVARGRRLAELGRFDEAEADFDKAVELAPQDLDVLEARDHLRAQRGNVPPTDAPQARLPADGMN